MIDREFLLIVVREERVFLEFLLCLQALTHNLLRSSHWVYNSFYEVDTIIIPIL